MKRCDSAVQQTTSQESENSSPTRKPLSKCSTENVQENHHYITPSEPETPMPTNN